MPSSLIWVAIVVGWIVVLFPMAAGKRGPVSRTGDATLQTRVLHRGGTRRTVRGPAAGHLSDPDYRPTEEQERARRGADRTLVGELVADGDDAYDAYDEYYDDLAEAEYVEEADYAEVVEETVAGGYGLADEEQYAEDDTEEYAGDAQYVDDQDVRAEVAGDDRGHQDDGDGAGNVNELRTYDDRDARVDDEEADPFVARVPEVPADGDLPRTGRGGFDPVADTAARNMRYRNRQRIVLGLAGTAVVTTIGALVLTSMLWWVMALAVVALAGYLTYLRRQVRLEEQIRARRMSRLVQARREADDDRREYVRPSQARRYGAVVLEADDGDPDFDHLAHYDEAVDNRGRHSRGDDDLVAG